ncbi:hypothetical protein EDC94DRAFT_656685 [Helicostylum pulchrum]|nr:hypothetical protein EDC94DRAFT_656685 [Helicostylum pulchrum]
MSTYAELFLQQLAITYEDSMLLTNTCSAAVYSYFTENELESNLNREAFLYYYSGIFDVPSFFDALPFMIVGTRSTRAIPSTGNVSFSKLKYWTITHPFLLNDDNPHTSFRAMYRMNLASFERLVNDLSQHPAFDLRAHNSIPVYIQISCAIWRLASCHLGYRMCNAGLGVSHRSYINFFRRTLIAIEGVYGDNISWPVDQERVQAIHTGFEWPLGPE